MMPEFVIIDEKTHLRLNDENIACDRLPKIYITTVELSAHLGDVYNHVSWGVENWLRFTGGGENTLKTLKMS